MKTTKEIYEEHKEKEKKYNEAVDRGVPQQKFEELSNNVYDSEKKKWFSEDEIKELFARLEELLEEDYDMSYTLGLPVRFRQIKSEFMGRGAEHNHDS